LKNLGRKASDSSNAGSGCAKGGNPEAELNKTGPHETGLLKKGLHKKGLHKSGLHKTGLHEAGMRKAGQQKPEAKTAGFK
jgi:hypothetical protein